MNKTVQRNIWLLSENLFCQFFQKMNKVAIRNNLKQGAKTFKIFVLAIILKITTTFFQNH